MCVLVNENSLKDQNDRDTAFLCKDAEDATLSAADVNVQAVTPNTSSETFVLRVYW